MKLPKGDPCAWIRSVAKAGDTIIDGGANKGEFTIAAAEAVGPSGIVVAIEPDPRCADAMHKVCEHFRQVRYINSALAQHDAGAMLTLGQQPEQSSLHPRAVKHSPGEVQVTTALLNDLVTGPVSAIKLDLQGGEPYAVLGGSEFLRSCPTWCVELWPWALEKNYDFLLWLFAEHDYAVHSFADGYPQLDYDDLLEWGETVEPHSHCNVIFQR